MRTGKAIALLGLLAILPLIPFAILGYAGQDFEFHVTSWMELRNAWHAGHLVPGWASQANFGLGDPHLTMYPPLSMMMGGLLAAILPLRLTPAVFAWLCLFVSGVSMYRASRGFVSDRDRLTAAVLYMLSPYLISTLLVRFAAAELLVQALLPLILFWFVQALWRVRKTAPTVIVLGVLLGLGWLTSISESIVLLYALLLTACIVAIDSRSIAPVVRLLLAEVLAAALAASYLAPLWQERKWVNQPVRPDPKQWLLFMRYTGVGVETLKIFKYSCWLFACAGMVLIVVCLWKRTSQWREDVFTRTWTYLAAVVFFFQLPLALVLWRYLPQLRSAGFPFRFLPLLGAALPLVLLARGTRPALRRPAYALLALLTLIPVVEHVRTQRNLTTMTPRFAVLEHRWQTDGYPGMPEFVPAGQRRSLGPLQGSHGAVMNSGTSCKLTGGDGGALRFACQVTMPVFYYPYWRARDQSGATLPTSSDPHGLLAVSMPPGAHAVNLSFEPRSRVRTISAAVSLITLLLVALALFRFRADLRPSARRA